MGAVAKRCKREGMRWEDNGLEAQLQLELVKYADPGCYRSFFDEVPERSVHRMIRCTASVTAIGGKF